MVVLLACASAPQASAQTGVLRTIVHEFVGLSGYWFTSGSASRALGTPKFGGDATFYVRAARRGRLRITGGPEIVGATDHWQPFSGGNSFSLTGASFRISTERKPKRPMPFVTAGVFYGHISSYRENFSASAIVPSAAVGAEIPVHRYITLTARYRISGSIGGVDTSGFSLGLKFF